MEARGSGVRAAKGPAGYFAIRGLEQQLIDQNGGAGSATSGNVIRGVAKANPLGWIYHNAANAVFGERHAYTGY
jgi:hypothetical protein